MARVHVQCPAAEAVHPVLSRNKHDVQCRIQGGLRPARNPDPNLPGGGEPAVCCGDYTKCRIWLVAYAIDHGPSTKAQRDQAVGQRHSHTMTGATRERIVL